MDEKQKNGVDGKVRFGFLSTAQIGRKNWRAVFHSGNAIVTAVASRDVDRGRKFIANCQQQAPFETAPAALGSYDELLASKTVDALYIPLPTALRKEWVIRAAEAGKHVVCEKPCALNAADLEEMMAACRRNRVQFMDGVMYMHHPRMGAMRSALNDEAGFGQIRRIMAMFSFRGGGDFFKANIRVHGDMEPAGCLGDLGWYCIRFMLWAMNWQLPREVSGRMISGTEPRGGVAPVPLDFSGELFFDGGVSGGFYNSFLVGMQQWANVSGTKGALRVNDFVQPVNDLEAAFEVNGAVTKVKSGVGGQPDGEAVSQQMYLFRHFSDLVLSGKIDAFWPEIALKTQRVLDACLESAGAGRLVALG
jgi:predicted dehydrogenase